MSEVVGKQVKAVRKQLDIRQVDLADRLKQLGVPIGQAALARLETGERRISVDEVLALSVALGVNPIHLFCASFAPQPVQVTPMHTAGPEAMLQFFRGQAPLEGMDEECYFSLIPKNERMIERGYAVQHLRQFLDDYNEAAAARDAQGMYLAIKDLRREIDRQQDQLKRDERKATKESDV